MSACRRKTPFPTHAAATWALHNITGDRLYWPIRVYLCRECGTYHLSSKPRPTKGHR